MCLAPAPAALNTDTLATAAAIAAVLVDNALPADAPAASAIAQIGQVH